MATDEDIDPCEATAENLIQEKHRRKFERLARDMDRLLDEIRAYCPDANMYLEDSGNWHLMTGRSHDEHRRGEKPRMDRIAASGWVKHSSGGAW